jgi:pimeloyl-ACP methyl ester carboxylesterase
VKQPNTSYARNGDINIAYQVVGDGPIDIVMTPGYISHLDLWWTIPETTAFLRRLASFSRLIIYDKRGTGLSDPSPAVPALEERMEDLHAVLNAVGSERAALFGISEGGPMSVLFAATYPDRASALILYGSFAKLTPNRDYFPELQPVFDDIRVKLDDVVAHWGEGKSIDVFAPNYADDPAQRRLWGFYERAAASPGMVRSLLDALVKIDVRHVLSAIRIPTLIMHRADDMAPPADASRYMAERIPNARYVELEGIDDVPWLGDGDALIDEIEEFLVGAKRTAEPERALATVLFTDIANSTMHASEIGDRRWREVLDQHDTITRRHLASFGGREVKHLGDGFLLSFDGPARAIRCARAIADDVTTVGIELRAGVHTGECEMRGSDIGGMAVHIGARVAAKAKPNEVLVSAAVRDLVVGSGIEFADRGVHDLKGVPGDWQLLAVGQEEIAADAAGQHPAEQRDSLAPNAADPKPGDRAILRLARSTPGTLRAASQVAGFRARRRAARRERDAARPQATR